MHNLMWWLFGIDTSNGWAFHPLASGFWLVLLSLAVVFLINGGIRWTGDKLRPKRAHQRKVDEYFRAHPEQKRSATASKW